MRPLRVAGLAALFALPLLAAPLRAGGPDLPPEPRQSDQSGYWIPTKGSSKTRRESNQVRVVPEDYAPRGTRRSDPVQWDRHEQRRPVQNGGRRPDYQSHPGWDQSGDRNDGAGNARLGRTLTGAAGVAAGGFAGAALSAAVIKAIGGASLPAIVPIVVGAAITTGGAYLGAKALSSLGQEADRFLGPRSTFTILGGVAGAVAGLTLMPALGPFAGPMGRVLGGVLGGVAGGVLGSLLAPALDKVATPPTLFGAAGAAIGGLGFGVMGGLAGAAGGYALGTVFDKGIYADRDHSVPDDVREARHDIKDGLYNLGDRFRHYSHTVGDWVNDRRDDFSDRTRGHWDHYDYNSYYYEDYPDSRQYATGTLKGDQSDPRSMSYGSDDRESRDGLAEARDDYHDALEQFQKVSSYGSQSERRDAMKRVQRAEQHYQRLKGSEIQGIPEP